MKETALIIGLAIYAFGIAITVVVCQWLSKTKRADIEDEHNIFFSIIWPLILFGFLPFYGLYKLLVKLFPGGQK